MMANVTESKSVYLQLASISGDGMILEIHLGTDSSGPYPIAWIRADEGDDRKFEVETPAGTLSVPLAEIERAIETAKEEVHSEDYYDRLSEDE
jgi:hypothetical protein